MAVATGTALLIGAGLTAAGGLTGAISNMSAQDRAAVLQDKAVQEWLKLQVPDPEKLKLTLEHFVSQGELTPEFESALKQDDSALKSIQKDYQARESQVRSLRALEEQGFGGEQVQDTAARQQALIDSGAKSRGQQEAIVSSLARRGQLGSGLELASRMSAAQDEADRLGAQSLGIESDRRTRALQAIEGAGDLAGKIEDRSFNQDSQKAAASDAIDRFNTQNAQSVLGRNTDRTNEASKYNLDRKQDIADRNVGVSNFEQQYNKELQQKNFDNQVKKTAGLTGQYGQQATNDLQAGKTAADMWGSIAAGGGKVAAGASKWNWDDEDKDKNA